MTIVKLKGGLGNQMFQYACGRMLSLKTGEPLKLDLSFFETNTAKDPGAPRVFALASFNIKAEIATEKELSSLGATPSFFTKLKRTLRRKRTAAPDTEPNVAELLATKPSYLDGYWQSETYFKDIEETIRKDFTPIKPVALAADTVATEIHKAKNPVSLHIRRGDYVHNPEIHNWHGVCSREYYNNAIMAMKEKYGHITLFVFSDDITWAKNNMTFAVETTYVSDPSITDIEELILQSKCQHHIIANSSFSWWGAWLGTIPTTTTIAPKQWFANSPAPKNLIPPSWIQM